MSHGGLTLSGTPEESRRFSTRNPLGARTRHRFASWKGNQCAESQWTLQCPARAPRPMLARCAREAVGSPAALLWPQPIGMRATRSGPPVTMPGPRAGADAHAAGARRLAPTRHRAATRSARRPGSRRPFAASRARRTLTPSLSESRGERLRRHNTPGARLAGTNPPLRGGTGRFAAGRRQTAVPRHAFGTTVHHRRLPPGKGLTAGLSPLTHQTGKGAVREHGHALRWPGRPRSAQTRSSQPSTRRRRLESARGRTERRQMPEQTQSRLGPPRSGC
jgi:hypothetical protein